MPELPDLTVYLEALEARISNQTLARARLLNPFVLRTAVPPLASVEGRRVVSLRRLGKRIVIALEGELFLVPHLMVAGRLRWLQEAPGKKAKAPGPHRASDEILHRARLSPVALTSALADPQISELWKAAREVLREWTDRLRRRAGLARSTSSSSYHPMAAGSQSAIWGKK